MKQWSSTIIKRTVGDPGPGLGQAHKCGELNPLVGPPSYPLSNWISNENTLKKTSYYEQNMKDNINMDF